MKRLEVIGERRWEVSSAGTRAVVSHPVHADAAFVLEQMGGGDSGFAARQLTSRLASKADLILTMTRAHRDVVLELAPHKLQRTFTLAEASHLASNFGAETITDLSPLRVHAAPLGDDLDIRDPIGQSLEVFASVGAQIAQLLPPVLAICMNSLDGRSTGNSD